MAKKNGEDEYAASARVLVFPELGYKTPWGTPNSTIVSKLLETAAKYRFQYVENEWTWVYVARSKFKSKECKRTFASMTRMRSGEMHALKWGDIDLKPELF